MSIKTLEYKNQKCKVEVKGPVVYFSFENERYPFKFKTPARALKYYRGVTEHTVSVYWVIYNARRV